MTFRLDKANKSDAQRFVTAVEAALRAVRAQRRGITRRDGAVGAES